MIPGPSQTFYTTSYTVNGLAGLQDVPIKRIAKFLGQSEIMNSLFSRFLQTCSGHAAKSFAESLLRAAIEAGENSVLSSLLAFKLVDVNGLVVGGLGRKCTLIEQAVAVDNFRAARILLAAGADPNKLFDKDEYDETPTVPLLLSVLLFPRRVARGGCDHNIPDCEAISERQCLADELLEAGATISFDILNRKVATGRTISFHILDEKADLLECLPEVWHRVVSTFLLSDHGEFLASRGLKLIAQYLNDAQATEIACRIIAECERLHDSACIRQHGHEVDDGITIAVKREKCELVQLLLPHTVSLPRILCASIQSGNELLINSVLSARPDVNTLVPHEDDLTDSVTSPFAEALRARNSSLVLEFEKAGILRCLNDGRLAGTAIVAATEAGGLDYVKRILHYYPNPTPELLSSALFSAVRLGDEDLVLALLDAGAIVPAPDGVSSIRVTRAEEAILETALERRNVRIVRALLRADVWGQGNIELLRLALKWGEESIIEDLLSTFDFPSRSIARPGNPRPFNRRLPDSWNSDIRHAADRNLLANAIGQTLRNRTLFQLVLQSKLATRAVFTECLVVALCEDDRFMLQQLLDLGADPSNEVIWEVATRRGPHMLQILTAELLRERTVLTRGMRTKHLKEAIRQGANASSCVDSLITSGMVDLFDTGTHYGHPGVGNVPTTPLGVAIMESKKGPHYNFRVVNALLDAKCDPNSVVRWGMHKGPCINETALLQAIETKVVDLVQLLIDRGARINEPPVFAVKRTPLQKAAEVGSLDIARLLLGYGADVNAEPAFARGGTALQLAAISGNCNMAAELLKHGASLYARPSRVHGRWPLEGAAEHGRLDMIAFLWKAKAETYLLEAGETGFEEKHCRRAMELAIENGHLACRDFIVELSGFPYREKPGPIPVYIEVGTYARSH
ncbi:hypothetical protein DL768_005752 [Monosporascus sp. mg162]|nr:hypothetical protein DL768_005752 [Monosporascus sp. mg162]